MICSAHRIASAMAQIGAFGLHITCEVVEVGIGEL
jgi:hypothetical protein